MVPGPYLLYLGSSRDEVESKPHAVWRFSALKIASVSFGAMIVR